MVFVDHLTFACLLTMYIPLDLDLSGCSFNKLFSCACICLNQHPFMTECFAANMDAAGEQGQLNARITVLVPGSIWFPDDRWSITPVPYDGIDCPANKFLLQCRLFYESLVEPNPTENVWGGTCSTG